MLIMTRPINVILLELETEVQVVGLANSLHSTAVEYLLRSGYGGESLHLRLRYYKIRYLLTTRGLYLFFSF